jgi:hypothetical protein
MIQQVRQDMIIGVEESFKLTVAQLVKYPLCKPVNNNAKSEC